MVALCGDPALLELWVMMLSQYGCGCFQRSRSKDLPAAVRDYPERGRIRAVVMPSWDDEGARGRAGKKYAEGPVTGAEMSWSQIAYARRTREILGPDVRIALAVPYGSAEPEDRQRKILLQAKIVRWPAHSVVVRVLLAIDAAEARQENP